MQSSSSAPVGRIGNGRLFVLFRLLIAAWFLFFTWRGLLVYHSYDDLMNLYGAWRKPVASFVKANIFFWTPSYRPFGGFVYHAIFSISGLNPHPLYIVYYAALLVNLWLAYLVLTRLGESEEIGAVAMLLYVVHGKLSSLYYSAGAMYDVFCFLFFSSALLIYLRARERGRLPGLWGTLGFLACLVCALNSKEMAVTLPVIVLLYELIFHPPDFRSVRALARWLLQEGRTALLGALCVLIYLPAKLGLGGIAHEAEYVPSYTWTRWLEDTGIYLSYVIYRNNPAKHFGVTPLAPLGVAVFLAVLIVIGLWARSRVVWFGLFFFVITLLPVSFIPGRLGFVLYLPLAGLALAMAAALVRLKESLWSRFAESRAMLSPRSASIALFVVTALVMAVIDYHFRPRAPRAADSPYKQTLAEFSRLYPSLPHGATILFVHSPLDDNWAMAFLLKLFYRDPDLFITQLHGPPEQRIPLDQLPRYDHIFDFENGHYIELDNADAQLSIQLHLVKASTGNGVFGEMMTIGSPGAAQYVVKGVLITDPEAVGYWTLDQAELRFQLSTVQHHVFREHFYLPPETFQQTGPLRIDFYVNGHLLDQARFAQAGDVVYQHDVPIEWLATAGFTMVKMWIHNPYIAPRDGARLGVLLRSAVFIPVGAS